ncbi:kynureninase-like [Maniola hyperantus]|uniref:kynureninase-like n=1 Tax=Aphantopus hyperantus TaxID=2795564 RepID=UPI0015698816|nr:kynureninase-like [Maniola hyperantus]
MDQQFKDGPDFPTFLDNNDPLGQFRRRFYIKKGTIYMCGNSLGLASKDAEDAILKAMDRWKEEGVKIWNVEDSKYYLYSAELAKLMADLVGVDPDEIAVTDSTTVNIHQAVSTFYKPTKDRYKILVDNINFPTDKYAIDSQVRLKGYDTKDAVKIVNCNDKFMDEDDIIDAMTSDVALVLLPTVYYRSAQILDMEKVTKAAKSKGIIIGWDLSHAIGSIEIDLKSLDIDFAVWCTYKYLNGGPGATSGLYINRKHFGNLPGLAGWFGNKPETQFQLRQDFDHQKNASGWQIGTPHVFSMAGLEGSLKMFNEAGMANLRKKSLHITAYLMFLIEIKLAKYGFTIGNPREDEKRGGHVCLEHDEGYRISISLKARGVVPDFRDPNVLRLTPTALYTSYEDVYKMVEILLDIVKNETYKKISLKRNLVV